MSRKPMILAVAVALLPAILFTISDESAAQGALTFGFTLGPNMSDCNGFDDLFGGLPAKERTRAGVMAGGYIAYSITPNIKLESGLMYSMEGCSRDYSFEEWWYDEIAEADYVQRGTFATCVGLDYLQIPIIARYTIGNPSGSAPYLLGGASIGFNLRSELDWELTGQVESFSQEGDLLSSFYFYWPGTADIGSHVNTTNISLILGGGYGLRLGPGRVIAEARYIYGLSDILKTTGPVLLQAETGGELLGNFEQAQTRVISFSVGYTLQ
jgi:hypothetical protein